MTGVQPHVTPELTPVPYPTFRAIMMSSKRFKKKIIIIIILTVVYLNCVAQ